MTLEDKIELLKYLLTEAVESDPSKAVLGVLWHEQAREALQ